MDASEPKLFNSISNANEVNSLRLGGLCIQVVPLIRTTSELFLHMVILISESIVVAYKENWSKYNTC